MYLLAENCLQMASIIMPYDCNASTKAQWENDPGVPLTTDQWEAILSRSNYLLNCVRYKVIQIKSYITPHKVKKISCNASDICWQSCAMTINFGSAPRYEDFG